MATYVQTPSKYEAIQWTGDNLTDLQALTLIDGQEIDWSANEDGSLHVALSGGGWWMDLPTLTWIVSVSYWGTFGGWDIPNSQFVDPATFSIAYTLAP